MFSIQQLFFRMHYCVNSNPDFLRNMLILIFFQIPLYFNANISFKIIRFSNFETHEGERGRYKSQFIPNIFSHILDADESNAIVFVKIS